jgi:hypothetical protein
MSILATHSTLDLDADAVLTDLTADAAVVALEQQLAS